MFFVSGTSPEKTGVYVGSVDSRVSTFLVRSTGNASFAPPGHLLFRRGSMLMAVPFDAKLLRLSGEPTPLADHGGAFSASSTGVLVYAPEAGSSRLVWLDRKGNEIEELPITGVLRYRRLSHDGRRLAASVPDPQTGLFDLWVYDLVRHFGNRLTFHSADEISPVWSPDDERIIFSSNRTVTRQALPGLQHGRRSRGGAVESLAARAEAHPPPPHVVSPVGRADLAGRAFHRLHVGGSGRQAGSVRPAVSFGAQMATLHIRRPLSTMGT